MNVALDHFEQCVNESDVLTHDPIFMDLFNQFTTARRANDKKSGVVLYGKLSIYLNTVLSSHIKEKEKFDHLLKNINVEKDALNDVLENINASVEANERAAGVNLPPTAQRIGVPNYEVHNPELEATLQSISGKIKAALPPDNKWGFMLMVFEYGEGGANFYASTADRHDIMALLKEWMAKQS